MIALGTRWAVRERPEALLLRGEELDAAKAWGTLRKEGAPKITEEQRAFITASQEAEGARLLNERARLTEIAVAQARTARLQQRARLILAAMALLVVCGIVIGIWQYRDNLAREAQLKARASGKSGMCAAAMQAALNPREARSACSLFRSRSSARL